MAELRYCEYCDDAIAPDNSDAIQVSPDTWACCDDCAFELESVGRAADEINRHLGYSDAAEYFGLS